MQYKMAFTGHATLNYAAYRQNRKISNYFIIQRRTQHIFNYGHINDEHISLWQTLGGTL